MTKLEAWYRRTFCFCSHIYDPEPDWKLGHVFWVSPEGWSFVYVGKNKLWVRKYELT